MTKLLLEHQVNPANDRIQIQTVDEPGPGGAHHHYALTITDAHGAAHEMSEVRFQNGAIGEVGVNGVTHEALLAIVADRLRDFQAGPYACRENALALTKIEEALHWMHARTRGRMNRGVEGTMTV